jgi:N-acetylglucosaminyldiphosphoundecaprenol N-acetyl-beta-D-mannosaminyltransferase
LATRLKRAKASVLWVGLGAPKQELWMARMQGKLPLTMLGVGAAFDYYAGTRQEAPRWMQALALEWAYRLAQEPGRLWRRYLATNLAFLLLAPLELLGLWPRKRGGA